MDSQGKKHTHHTLSRHMTIRKVQMLTPNEIPKCLENEAEKIEASFIAVENMQERDRFWHSTGDSCHMGQCPAASMWTLDLRAEPLKASTSKRSAIQTSRACNSEVGGGASENPIWLPLSRYGTLSLDSSAG